MPMISATTENRLSALSSLTESNPTDHGMIEKMILDYYIST